jgi:enterochelin esterase-like enzyme
MVVLTHNQSGDGGWYDGHPGLYSAAAYNKLTSKPSTYASETNTAAVEKTVAAQIAAIEAKDISAYAATVDAQYFQSGTTKDMLLEDVSAYMEGDGEIQISDKNAYVFESDSLFYYQASRTLVDAAGATHELEINEYYQIVNGTAVLYGEHDRFFSMQISSAYRAKMLNSGEAAVEENFMVYLPEGYFDEENANKRYPTAYVFHQLNSSSNSYAIDGIDQILDEGIADGSIKDMILVIPDSNNNGFWYNGWDKMVTEEILPYIDANYRTIADARYRFTAGASMGGSGSYYIGLTNPNLFSGIISFFGAINMGGKPLDIAQEQSSEYLGYFTQYFVCGNRDLYKFGIPAITLDKLLRSSGHDLVYRQTGGRSDQRLEPDLQHLGWRGECFR